MCYVSREERGKGGRERERRGRVGRRKNGGACRDGEGKEENLQPCQKTTGLCTNYFHW